MFNQPVDNSRVGWVGFGRPMVTVLSLTASRSHGGTRLAVAAGIFGVGYVVARIWRARAPVFWALRLVAVAGVLFPWAYDA